MNNKYDEEFFNDLDKTTDLLKAFKPHVTIDDDFINWDINIKEDKKAKEEVSLETFVIPKEEEPVDEVLIDKIETMEIEESKPLPKSDIGDIIHNIGMGLQKKEQEQEQKKIKQDITPKKVVKRKLIFNKFELSFCILSLIFIFSCIVYLIRS